jgi:hypothetical protein
MYISQSLGEPTVHCLRHGLELVNFGRAHDISRPHTRFGLENRFHGIAKRSFRDCPTTSVAAVQ